MADAIRATVADIAGAEYAESVPVLYGGSVTADSFGEFIDEPAIDGALIGGASLKPDQMSGIAAIAAEAAAARAKRLTALRARPRANGPERTAPGTLLKGGTTT